MEKQRMIDVCRQFGIVPVNIEILRMNERVLAKIVGEKQEYFLKGESADKEYWEQCCRYAKTLSEKGMNVTHYEKSIDDTYVIQVEDKVFTLEQSLSGKPIETVTDREISEIGRLLGIQHCISMNIPTPFSTATSWSFFGGNQTDDLGDYDENERSFWDFQKHYHSHPLFSNIETIYHNYRKGLNKVWNTLPQGAVQGDFCYYNMLQESDGNLGLYDFNLAGNEVFVNECIGVGVFHAWHAPYVGDLNEEDRFRLFIESYRKERPFNELEEANASSLKAIIRAFRYDRIADGLELKSEQEQNLFIQETLQILENRQ